MNQTLAQAEKRLSQARATYPLTPEGIAALDELKAQRDALLLAAPKPPKKPRACCSCRNGGVDYRGDEVRLYVVRDPDTKKLALRGYLCQEHADMYADDGYEIRG